MSVKPSVVRTMVPGEVERNLEDIVIIKKQLYVIGHSYIRRLRDFVPGHYIDVDNGQW